MLYRWPQGRILRVILIVAVLLITVDLGRSAWGHWSAWLSAPEAQVSGVVYTVILAGLAAIVCIGGLAAIAFMPRSAQFLIEVEQEMAKVTWPSRADLIRSTILIAVTAILLALLIFFIDYINITLVHGQILGGGVR